MADIEARGSPYQLLEDSGIRDRQTIEILLKEYELRDRIGVLRSAQEAFTIRRYDQSENFEGDYEGIREWLDTNKESIDQILDQLDLRLRLDEIEKTLKAISATRKDSGEASGLPLLSRFIASYPWLNTAYCETGITWDEIGEPTKALAYIETAIALIPQDPIPWHSFSNCPSTRPARLLTGTMAPLYLDR
jgi:hypothetical protein